LSPLTHFSKILVLKKKLLSRLAALLQKAQYVKYVGKSLNDSGMKKRKTGTLITLLGLRIVYITTFVLKMKSHRKEVRS
jgi:hypothetical protein